MHIASIRKTIILLIASLCYQNLSAQVTVSVETLTQGTARYNFDPSGEIYFSGDRLVLMESLLTANTVAYNIDDVAKVSFEGDFEGINPIARAELSLHPNPARGHVAISGIGSTPQRIDIYSAAGLLMLSQLCSDGQNLDISRLSPGLYFVRISGVTLKLSVVS